MYLDRRTATLEEPRSTTRPLERLEAMGPEARLRAYRAGRLSRIERTAWAAAYPDEVPIVNDELEWIALGLADLD
jgi:hypothetical protein